MQKYTFKFSFQNRKYKADITANSEYGAHIEFEKYIRHRIVVESVEEESPKDADIDSILNFLNIKK